MTKKNEKPATNTNEVVNKETGEIENTTMTVSQQALAGTMTLASGVQIKVARQVTLPVLKHREGDVICITVTRAMYVGKELKVTATGEKQKAATLVGCTDINTGRSVLYIVPVIVKDTWESEYPDNSYVGKSFAIRKLPARDGKRYKDIEMVEVEIAK